MLAWSGKHRYKSIEGPYRPVRVADGPMTARCRFIKNASWDFTVIMNGGTAIPTKLHVRPTKTQIS